MPADAAVWKLIVDTDIGSDVDDVIALAQLLTEPGVDLVGVTTAYGDTLLRARIAARLCELAGRDDVPVFAGVPEPLADVPVWWPGHEGQGIDRLDEAVVDRGEEAHDALIRLAREHEGSLDVLAIAPLTNVALAILGDPAFAGHVRHLWVMGGHFGPDVYIEHNLKSDPLAAWIVLRSGIPMTICGLETTLQVDFGAAAAVELERRGGLLALVADQMRRWWQVSGRGVGDPPHDPVTVLTRLRPDLFTFEDVAIEIVGAGPDAGRVTARPAEGSSTRIATSVQPQAAHDRILDGLLGREAKINRTLR